MELIGELLRFDSNKDNWRVYIGKLERYFELKNIPELEKREILLTFLSENDYQMLCDVCDPQSPHLKSYAQLREYLNQQFFVKYLVGHERYNNYMLNCNAHQTITSLITRLTKLSVDGRLESYFELALLNYFISVRHSKILYCINEENENVTTQLPDVIMRTDTDASKGKENNRNSTNLNQSVARRRRSITPTATSITLIPVRRSTRKRSHPNYNINYLSKRAFMCCN